ncbi:MAG: tsaB [Chitinophagaceae bacterium]|nr:tsaB [Chitinophagaceae bacterium]
MILCIETSSSVCSVAVFSNGNLIAWEEIASVNSHSNLIIPMVDAVLQKAGVGFEGLQAIAVSAGPGSYTGLRIGVSTAKGFCDAHDIPLIAVPTLEAMAKGFVQNQGLTEGLICPMFDARRMEVYYWLGDTKGTTIDKVQSLILEEDSFKKQLEHHKIYFIGNGAKKTSLVLKDTKALFDSDFQPSAKWLGSFATEKYKAKAFEDLAYFEPFYLKDSESHLKPLKPNFPS